MFERVEQKYLNGVAIDFVDSTRRALVARWDDHDEWLNGRLDCGIDPYSKFTESHILPQTAAGTRDGRVFAGVNFASQEYLNLASHPAVHEAATRAMALYGVHSAGSAALAGNTRLSRELEERLAAFLGYRDCTVFPTGWGAGYGVIKTLITPKDHIIIDVLAHARLPEGTRNATPNVHAFPHLSNEGVARRLGRIRREHPAAGILVVTETVFSMDGDTPDIAALSALCREYEAVLLVDVAHDLGAIGPTGRGALEKQGMVGKPDLLMGSFSKTFASNGGFVACNNPSLKLALRYNCGPLTFTNALPPVQCAIVLKCLDIIDSDEGAERRERLMNNILYMRAAMEGADFKLLGRPSPIIPAILGDNALSRLMTRYALEAGGIVNLVEYPAVSRNTCRWRLQVMALHEQRHIDRFVEIAIAARAKAQSHVAEIQAAEIAAEETRHAVAL
jgi:glycine C-acetyltransferase